MTTDATKRPDLDAIEAYCADFEVEVVGEAGSTCAACDGPERGAPEEPTHE